MNYPHEQYSDTPPYATPNGRHDVGIGVPPTAPMPSGEDKSMAALAHASSLIALVFSAGWLSFLGPLVMWIIFKNRSPFVRQAAAGSFNFNLGMCALSIMGWICFFTLIGIPIALILWAASCIGQFVWHLIAMIRAMEGEPYHYPLQIPVLR